MKLNQYDEEIIYFINSLDLELNDELEEALTKLMNYMVTKIKTEIITGISEMV